MLVRSIKLISCAAFFTYCDTLYILSRSTYFDHADLSSTLVGLFYTSLLYKFNGVVLHSFSFNYPGKSIK